MVLREHRAIGEGMKQEVKILQCPKAVIILPLECSVLAPSLLFSNNMTHLDLLVPL